MHPEGVWMMRSVTCITSALPILCTPKLRTFYHPKISPSHCEYLNFPKAHETFTDALNTGRHITCCIKNGGQGQDVNHCVVLLEESNGNYNFKNSTKIEPLIAKSTEAVEVFNLSLGGQVRLPDPVEGFCLDFQVINQ